MSLADKTLTHMAGGFLLMGLWAAFANRAHAWPAPLLAGLVQGTMTAVITLGLKRIVESLAARLTGTAALILPTLAACATSLAILSAIHTLAGTPEVLATLALPTTVATCYALLYAWRLKEATHG